MRRLALLLASLTLTSALGGEVTSPVSQGGLSDIQTFSSTGTWTKPSGAPKLTRVYALGGGGGGGGGARVLSGNTASGGGGGGGGAMVIVDIPTASLGATEVVTVGAVGTLGAGATVDG